MFALTFQSVIWVQTLVREDQYSFVNKGANAKKIMRILYTSTKVSEVAREVAKVLEVKIYEHIKISDYPTIKCNISMRDDQKIYHLPFDQQYDRVKIKHQGERYVHAVADAEILGFRRAWRWHPEKV